MWSMFCWSHFWRKYFLPCTCSRSRSRSAAIYWTQRTDQDRSFSKSGNWPSSLGIIAQLWAVSNFSRLKCSALHKQAHGGSPSKREHFISWSFSSACNDERMRLVVRNYRSLFTPCSQKRSCVSSFCFWCTKDYHFDI